MEVARPQLFKSQYLDLAEYGEAADLNGEAAFVSPVGMTGPAADLATSNRLSSREVKCTNARCTVGRCSSKNARNSSTSWFRKKIHLVDVSKLRQPKLCMKTRLVDGEDCKPLLIKSGEDITVPLVSTDDHGLKEEAGPAAVPPHHSVKARGGMCKRLPSSTSSSKTASKLPEVGKKGRCTLILDALARTFCLPLLG